MSCPPCSTTTAVTATESADGATLALPRRITLTVVALKWVQRLWIVFGLGGIVAYSVITFSKPGAGRDIKEARPLLIAVGAWLVVLVILAMAMQLRAAHQLSDTGTGSAREVLRMLAVRPDLLPQADRALRRMSGTMRYYAFLAPLFLLGPAAGIVLSVGGKKYHTLGIGLIVAAVAVAAIGSLVAIVLVRRPIWRWLDDLVKPLGLGVVAHPVLMPYFRGPDGGVGVRAWGNTVLGGERGARHVEIVDTVTAVSTRMPSSSVGEHGGRLVVESGPTWLARAVDVPGPWRGVRVQSDGACVKVTRRVTASTPTGAFLFDLALAERIAAASGA